MIRVGADERVGRAKKNGFWPPNGEEGSQLSGGWDLSLAWEVRFSFLHLRGSSKMSSALVGYVESLGKFVRKLFELLIRLLFF